MPMSRFTRKTGLVGEALLAAVLAAATGCVHRAGLTDYRLLRLDQGQVLLPPQVAASDLAHRTFIAGIPAGKGPCPAETGPIQIRLSGKRIRVTVDREALIKEPLAWLSDWAIRAESQGCARTGDGERLAHIIVESIPLDSAVASRLLSPAPTRDYVELGAVNRLQVNSPIMREGVPMGAASPEIARIDGVGNRVVVELKPMPEVIGYETAWYAVEPNEGRPGYHFVPLSADRNIQGSVEHAAGPAANPFQFPPQAAFFRLFYKTDDNGALAIIVCGATREDLDRRMKAVAADFADCQRQSGMCLALPRQLGVNPFMAVDVNGNEVRVGFGSTVGTALYGAGLKSAATALPTLQVTRLFHGVPRTVQFNRDSQEILNLQLIGGERISF